MSENLEIAISALRSPDAVSAEVVRRWMHDSDLHVRGVSYHLLQYARDRIVPPLSTSEQCSFMLDYLFDCLVSNPEADDFLHSGFEAAWELARLVKHLETVGDNARLIYRIVQRLTQEYLAADEPTRNRIETGAVEHMMELPSIRRYFASWKSDPRLCTAYRFCLQWGEVNET